MLRYELTIRSGMLNYLHKAHLFRRNCPFWKQHFKICQDVELAQQRIERRAKKIGSLPPEEKEAYRLAHPYERIKREHRDIHSYVTKVITKSTFFLFEVDEEDALYNEQMVNYDSRKAKFSPELLELCLHKLVSFMQEFQIKELPDEAKIERAIDEYNLRHTKKLPKSVMLDYYHDLVKCGSFKEASIFRSDDRSTMYRYKQRFKKIGITDSNLIPLTHEGIPGAPLDLSEYHGEHMYNPFFHNKGDYFDLS